MVGSSNHKGIVILVNKWDLVDKDTESTKAFSEVILEEIAPFVDVPIVFISSLTKQRVYKAIEMAVEVYRKEVNEYLLENSMILCFQLFRNIHRQTRKICKNQILFTITQYPSSVCFFCNLPQYVKEPYKRFLENK